MLATFTRILDASRRRRSSADALRHLDARLLADVGLRRVAAGGRIERLAAE